MAQSRKTGQASGDAMKTWTNKQLLNNWKRMVRGDWGGSDPAKITIKRITKILLGFTSDSDYQANYPNRDINADIDKLIKILEIIGTEGILTHLANAVVVTIQDTTASSRKRLEPYYEEFARRFIEITDQQTDDIISKIESVLA